MSTTSQISTSRSLNIGCSMYALVLLDYNTNPDVNNPKKALSHASLIKAFIEGNYPE